MFRVNWFSQRILEKLIQVKINLCATSNELQQCLLKQSLKTQTNLKELEIMY